LTQVSPFTMPERIYAAGKARLAFCWQLAIAANRARSGLCAGAAGMQVIAVARRFPANWFSPAPRAEKDKAGVPFVGIVPGRLP
jgi:hypothetical protein